jgi:hypothetical protein
MGRKQKGGSFQVWMRKTMYDNLTGNKVVKKRKKTKRRFLQMDKRLTQKTRKRRV